MKTLGKGLLIVVVVLVLLAMFSDNRESSTPPSGSEVLPDEPQAIPSEPQALPDVRHLLSSGNGHDWIRLSAREKVRLCQLIQEATGEHETWTYMEFLASFYKNNNSLNTDIAQAAAVAAAMDLSSE